MKKQIPSTLILNTNDAFFFFVEGKYSTKKGPFYYVYYNDNEKPDFYRAENFVEVHGLHDKESVVKFTKRALLDLTVLNGVDPRVSSLYDIFHKVHDLAITQDEKRPKLGKLKRPFINAISVYNEVKDLIPNKLDISYEEDYELVTIGSSRKNVKTIEKQAINLERKQVKKIVTSYEPEDRGIQRKLRYD